MDIRDSKNIMVKDVLDIKKSDFIQIKKTDFWNELSRTERNEINDGIIELERGEKASYDSFIKKINM